MVKSCVLPKDWCRDGEEWRAIEGHEGAYEVSNLGRVRSLYRIRHGGTTRARILQPCRRNEKPHLSVYLSKECVKYTYYVHQLVARAFLGPQPVGTYPLHNNGNAQDNRVENLRYGTQKENMDDAAKHGTLAIGVRCGRAKLTDEAVRQIRAMRGIKTEHELAAQFGVSHTSIWQVQVGKTWTHVE
jgi:hypothetical protein